MATYKPCIILIQSPKFTVTNLKFDPCHAWSFHNAKTKVQHKLYEKFFLQKEFGKQAYVGSRNSEVF